jgi:beta-lactamase superfamily II metal-dependent hydrolase
MNKPDDNEIEISIFGTGSGECLAVHIGSGKWILIDSCYLSKNKSPLNINYLESLGLNLRSSIKLIICTHWHDDHTRGLSEIFDAIDAPIVLSVALQQIEFLRLATMYQALRVPTSFSSGVYELSKIFESKQKNPSKKIIFAINNMRKIVEISEGNHAILEFLSPSDEDVAEAIKNFSALIPLNKECTKTIPAINNDSCIVTLINILSDSILCGADKECSNSAEKGWGIIFRNFISQGYRKSSVYKIAHHGSKNGDHECIWRGILNENPIAILTPFLRSRLPRETDIERINKNTINAYSTGPKRPSKSALLPEEKKLLRDFDMDKKICQINKNYGQIILRKKIASPTWTVSTIGTAYKL